jgi:hypothetical protein
MKLKKYWKMKDLRMLEPGEATLFLKIVIPGKKFAFPPTITG